MVIAFALISFAHSAHASSGVTYQGRIIKPDGDALEGAQVQFRMQVRTPGNENCLMFEEVQQLDMRDTKGLFGLVMGNGTRTDSTGYGLEAIFANRGTFTLPAATCNVGTTYSPNFADGRKLVVYFKDETMSTWEPMPTTDINSVPFAFEAKSVAGFNAESLLRVVDAGSLGNVSPLSTANYNSLMALIAGTSSAYQQYGKLQGVNLPTLTNGQVLGWAGGVWSAMNPLAGLPTFAQTALPVCNAGEFLRDNGSGLLVCATPATSGGTVTAITAGAGLTGGTITTTGTIALPVLGAGGTAVKVTYDTFGRITAAGSLAEADIPTLVTAGKVSGDAINTGTIGGNAAVNTSGNITTSGAVNAGSISATGAITAQNVTASTMSTNAIRVFETTNNFKVTIVAPGTLGADYTMTLPGHGGAPGQVLTTDGAGSLTWSNTAVTGITSLTGDVTATGTGAVAATLANTGVTSGTYGSSSTVPTFTVDSKGRLTAAGSVTITGTLPGGTAGGDLGGTYPNPSVDRIRGMSVNAGTLGPADAGKAFVWQGTEYQSQWFGIHSLKTAAGANQFASAGCNANQTLTWTALNDVFTCVDIAGLNASVITTGTLSASVLPIVPVAKGGTNSPTALFNNRIVITSGGAVVEAPALLDGQLLIGQTGGAPLPGTLTAGPGISISNGAGSITISASGAGAALTNGRILVGNASNIATEVTPAGDATLSNTGSVVITANAVTTTKIADDNVSFAKLQNINTNRIVGRSTAGAGDAEEISLGAGLTLANGTLAATVSSVIGSSLTDSRIWIGDAGNVAQSVSLSGDATVNNAGVVTITANAITGTELANDAVTTAKIADQQVTFAKLQNVNSSRILGRSTAGAGVAEEIALGAGLTLTNGTLASVVSSVSGSTLTDARIWVGDAANTAQPVLVSGDVTMSNAGVFTIGANTVTTGKIADNAVTNQKLAVNAVATTNVLDDAVTFAKLQNVNTNRILGRSTASAGDIEEIQLGAGLSLTGGTLAASGSGTALTNSYILVGDAGGLAAQVLMSGDVTINNTGVATISANAVDTNEITNSAVTTTKIADDNVTFAKLQNINTNRIVGRSTAGAGDAEEISLGAGLTLANGTLAATVSSVIGSSLTDSRIWIGDAGNVAQSVSLSGDATVNNAGVVTITANAITGAELANDAITTAKIADDQVTFAKLQNINTNRILGRSTAAAGDIEEIQLGGGISLAQGTLGLVVGGGLAITNGTLAATGGGGDFYRDGSVSMTGALRAVSGSTSSPGYTFGADTSTGLYMSGPGTLSLATNGTEKLRIYPNGNIGVGSSAWSGEAFQVNGGEILLRSGSNTNDSMHSGIKFTTDNDPFHVAIRPYRYFASGVLGMAFFTSTGPGPAERMRLDSNGNLIVGGTLNFTGSRLDVRGGAISAGSQSSTLGGEVRIHESGASGTNYMAFRAPSSIAADTTWTLPSSDGGSGTVLQTNGSGSLTWVSMGGGGDFFRDGSVPMTGQLVAGTGSATAPSITFTGDTNSGFFSFSDNSFSVATNGQERIRFSNNGAQSLQPGAWSLSGGVSAGFPSYTFENDTDTGMYRAGADSLAFATAGTQAMTVSNVGNVGIGTTGMEDKLQVNGSVRIGAQTGTVDDPADYILRSNGQLRIQANASGSGDPSYTNLILEAGTTTSTTFPTAGVTFNTNGVQRMIVNSVGNVGIGTLSPANRLSVFGGAIAAGSIGSGAGNGGQVRFYDLGASGNNYVAFRAPDSIAADVAWTLPSTDGTAGQILQTNGAGSLAWATASGGGGALSALTNATTTNTLANGANAQVWNWDALTTQAAMTYASTSMTSGSVLALTNSNDNNASTGNILNVTATGQNNRSIAAAVTHGGYDPQATGVKINMTANSAGNAPVGLDIVNESENGYGAKILLNNNSSGGTATALDVVNRVGGGNGIAVNMTNNGSGVIGSAIKISSENGDGYGVDIAMLGNGSKTPKGLRVTNAADDASAYGAQLSMTSGSAAGRALSISHAGAGDGVYSSVASGRAGYFSSTSGYGLIVGSGAVGIGTAAPGTAVHVFGSPNLPVTSQIENGNAGNLALAQFQARNDSNKTLTATMHSSGFTGTGAAQASAGALQANGGGGMSLTASDAAGAMRFYTGGNAAGNERMRIDASGNVGIGTTATSYALDVSAGSVSRPALHLSRTGADDGLFFHSFANHHGNMSTGMAFDPTLGWTAKTTTAAIVNLDNSGIKFFGDSGLTIGANSLTPTTRMTILNTGNVGIGTTAPSDRFSVFGGAIAAGSIGSGTGNAGQVRLYDLGSSGNNYVAFRAPDSIAADVLWTLPPADGGTGQVLSTNGAGSLSWVAAGGTGSNPWSIAGTTISYSAGRVGIGTSAPAGIFDVRGGVASSGVGTPINIYGQTGAAGQIGGNITIKAGDGGTGELTSGDLNLVGGFADAGNGSTGGYIQVRGSQWTGGHMRIESASGETNGQPGSLFIATGTTANNGSGHIDVSTGNGVNGPSGNIYLYPGPGNGIGNVIIGASSLTARGMVGIGTNAPAAKAHIFESSTAGNASLEVLRLSHIDSNSAAANGIGTKIVMTAESTTNNTFPEIGVIEAVLDDATNASKDSSLRFYTLGPNAGSTLTLEKMRIDSSGNVGIGVTNPLAKLHVANGAIMAGAIATGVPGELRFAEALMAGSNYVGFRAPYAVPADLAWYLPGADGTAGQVLATNGAGSLTWSTVAGGGGDFYKNGSVTMTGQLKGIAGSSAAPGFTFDGATNTGMFGGPTSVAFAVAGLPKLSIYSSSFDTSASGGMSVRLGAAPTAALPAYAFVNDTDTGMFTPGANTLAFSTGGQQRVVVDSNGRIGVGTSNPTQLLHIYGSGSVRNVVQSTTAGASVVIEYSGLTGGASPQTWLTGINLSSTDGSYGWYDQTTGQERLRIASTTGQVSIGTAAPYSGTRLHVNGGAIAAGSIGSGSGNGGQVRFYDLGTSGNNYVAFRAPDQITSDLIFTLPGTLGAANSVLMTDATGSLTWSAAGGGSGDFMANGSVTMSAQLRGFYGDNNNPGFSFAGDTDTGMYRFGANTLAFASAGNTTMVLSGNNVGIGSTAPTVALDIAGRAAITASGNGAASGLGINFTPNGSGSIGYGMYMSLTDSTTSTGSFRGIYMNTGALSPATGEKTLMRLDANSSPVMVVQAGGDVGIGTAAAYSGSRLHVTGGAIAAGSIGSGTGNAGQVRFYDLGTSGNNYVAFRAPDQITSDLIFTLPGTLGAANSVLITDATGSLTWSTVAGGGGDFYKNGSVTMTGQLRAIAGSSLLPGISFGAGSNTGMYLAGANTLAFSTGGQQRVVVDSIGRVGIGTSTPTAVLDVQGTINGSRILSTSTVEAYRYDSDAYASSSSGSNAPENIMMEMSNTYSGAGSAVTLAFKNYNGSANAYLTAVSTSTVTSDMAFVHQTGLTSYAERMRITSGGNVGVGTTAPYSGARLHVTGGAIAAGSIGSGTGNAGQVRFYDLGTSGNNYVAFRAPDQITSDLVFTLPGTLGAANSVLTTSATGSLTWSAAGGGSGDFLRDGSLTMTGPFKATAGSAGSPSVTFAADLDTGIFSSTSDAIQFSTAGNERARINSDGLRINSTSAPGAGWPLIVGATVSTNHFLMQNSASGAATTDGLRMSLNSIAASIVNQESGELELGTSNQVRLHIGASGNVGIGTTTPAAALHVVAPTGEVIQDYYNTSNSTPAFVARHARGNLGAGSQTLAEDGLAMIAGEGWHSGGGFSAAYPGIEIVAEQNFTSTAQGSYLAFLTTSLGTNASTEKMRITAGGSLGLGTLTPSERLEVAGSVKAVGFVSTSDARLKRDIHPTAGLEIIRQLTGVDWRWKDTLKKDSGVIAQEVERVMPHAVHTDANSGFKAVKYDALIAPLIQATNELDRMCSAGAVANDRQDRDIASLKEKVGSLEEKNSTLESENEKLKGEVDDMKKRLEKLESLMLKGK